MAFAAFCRGDDCRRPGRSQERTDENPIRTFASEEPLFIADKDLNSLFDGTYYLEIMIETPDVEDLFKTDNLKRIESLQVYLQTLAHVQGSTSIVDYLKQMNRALNEGRTDAYQLPVSAELAAQYFLLYSSKVIIFQEFGLLVAVAIATSFLTSMTVLPALLKVIQPNFIRNDKNIENQLFSNIAAGEK